MGQKLLVVDDTPDTLDALSEFLTRAGYEVLPASTFEQARKIADEQSPDLLIVDIRLGAYNGLQLVVRERLAKSRRPVIVISGFPDQQTEAEVRKYGAEFLAKPVRPRELVDLVARLLSGPAPGP